MKLPELVSTYFLASHSFLKLQKTGFSIYSECALEKVRRCGYFKDQVRWIPVAYGIVGYWALEPDSLCLIPAPLLTSYMDVGHLLNHPGLHSPYVWNGVTVVPHCSWWRTHQLLWFPFTSVTLLHHPLNDYSPRFLPWSNALFPLLSDLIQNHYSLECSNAKVTGCWSFPNLHLQASSWVSDWNHHHLSHSAYTFPIYYILITINGIVTQSHTHTKLESY